MIRSRIIRPLFFVFITALLVTANAASAGFYSSGLNSSGSFSSMDSPEEDWTLVSIDPDERNNDDIKALYTQMRDNTAFFKVELYQDWIDFNNIVIFIDADHNQSTGLQQVTDNTRGVDIGADYIIGIFGGEVLEAVMYSWNETANEFDRVLFPLAYSYAPDHSAIIVFGIDTDDLQLDETFRFAVSCGHQPMDWVPDNDYVTFISVRYDHDIMVTLEAPLSLGPDESSYINVTAYNTGSSSETAPNLQLFIDGENVGTLEGGEELAPGEQTATLRYLWHPSEQRRYNITAFAVPVTNEKFVENNVETQMASVTQKIAIITDWNQSIDSELLTVFKTMPIPYDLYLDNPIYLYTENLTLLQQYVAVVFNNDRPITALEEATLNAYLNSGGNLLVTGDNALGGAEHWRLAGIVRSTIYEDIGHYDGNFTITNSSHPITDGPYSHFSTGQVIPQYGSEAGFNDIAEADVSRGAVTVAELSNGNDKIISTNLLPGKVVYWNGGGCSDWQEFSECAALLKNIIIWFVDVLPPVTTADYDGLWHKADFTISLSANDCFGVPETYYKINGGATKNLHVDGQPQIAVEGDSNTLEYWSVDWIGHEENHKTVTNIKLDKTAPTASITTSLVQTGSYTVRFDASSSTDSSGITSYKWSFGDNSQGTGITVNHAYAAFGTYTATLTVTDTAGNSAAKSMAVTLYKASPEATPKPTTPTPSPTPTTQPAATPQPIETTTLTLILISIVIVALLIGGAAFYLKTKNQKIRLKVKKEEKV